MNEVTTTLESLGQSMLGAAQGSFGPRAVLVGAYLKSEMEKLAITLRMIAEGTANGSISQAEAHLLLNQQKVATSAVLTAAEGMTLLAVQAAIDAALGAVRDFVNGKLGFALL